MKAILLAIVLFITLTSLSAQTVQQRLDGGESPCALYDDGIQIDSLYGKTYQGGLIFYVDTEDTIPGIDGLVAAPVDQSTGAQWGCHLTPIPGADGTAVGTGQQNTSDILSGCATTGIAARIADNYDDGTYSDWFLPSSEELDLMWENLADSDGDGTNSGPADPGNLGGFASASYWSSTEINFGNAYHKNFSGGLPGPFGKVSFYRVRAVRAFSCQQAVIPTMSQWGLFLFGLMVFTVALVAGYNVRKLKTDTPG